VRFKDTAGRFNSHGSLPGVTKRGAIVVDRVDQIANGERMIVHAGDQIRLSAAAFSAGMADHVSIPKQLALLVDAHALRGTGA
jgi:hypothetical protein